MKLFVFFIFFLLLGAFFIISEENIQLNSISNFETFFNIYFSWIDEIAANGKTVSGYVVGMDWLPE